MSEVKHRGFDDDGNRKPHPFDASCSCSECQWQNYVDDTDTLELEFEADQAELRYNKDMGYDR